jgi:hypothetical protein
MELAGGFWERFVRGLSARARRFLVDGRPVVGDIDIDIDIDARLADLCGKAKRIPDPNRSWEVYFLPPLVLPAKLECTAAAWQFLRSSLNDDYQNTMWTGKGPEINTPGTVAKCKKALDEP